VLSDGREKYDREHIKEVLDDFYSLPSPEEKTKYLLSSKPYPMRNFLENYGKVIYTYTVEYNGHDPYVFIGLPETYEVDTDHVYDICINNYHIPSDEIAVIKKNITDVFRVPSVLFKEGINIVEITVLENNTIEYVRVAKDDIPTEEGGIVYKFPVFKRFISVSDVYVLEKSSGNESLTYPNSYGNGYTQFNDVHISYNEEKKEIIVRFDRYPDNDIIIYNSNFTTSYRYQKPIDSTALDVMIPLYAGSDIDPVPYIPKGKLTIYAGNDKLIQGIDYFIKHPVNDDKAGGSFIIVKRAMLPGTNFDIYFSNIITKKVIEKEGYFTNNPYGLFYLGNLEFPFSLKYLDVYINNRRCTEADIDILSDKLIRIHSLPVPMFDLSVDTTFTVEDEYLQPYIDLYEEDDFEKYIASLFRGVFHNRPYNPDETNPDYNAIYESFIDSVDSVNKRPNPVAREAEWIPSENDNPSVIGIYNTGDAMGGNDIYASIVIGYIYVVAGEGGRVASCNTKTPNWNNYDSGGRYSCDGSHFIGNITDIAFYRGLLVFSTDKAEIAYYDVVNDVWGYPNRDEGKLRLNKLPHDYFPGAIYKMVIVEDCLVIMGEGGNVTSYNFNGDSWYSYTDYSRKNAFTAQGIMDDIYDAYVHAYYQLGKYNIVLITFGKNGEIASGFYETNHWTKSNGERLHPLNSGPQYFHDGSSRDFKDIYKVNRYLDYLVLYGKEGLVTLYSLDTLTALSVGDSRNISNDGKHNGYRDTRAAINYSGSILVTGASEGKVSSYFGENERWHEYNGETGIANDGNVMDGHAIYTISYTFVDTNYIIFAGEGGKVGSYNVDVHELSFRFNPYKTAFLLWYTTPGSAYINTSWTLPENVMDLFSLYKETGDLNYDITLAAGDQDIIADIDMDERGKYPYTHAARRQYIVDFILSLDEGNYTADEVWEKYMNSYHKYILYPWDVIPLAGGDELEREEDIDITIKGVLNPAS
jgi:hypothetical protein